jgi:hypothetical protein
MYQALIGAAWDAHPIIEHGHSDVATVVSDVYWADTLAAARTLHALATDCIRLDIPTAIRTANPTAPHPKSKLIIKAHFPGLAKLVPLPGLAYQFSEEAEVALQAYRNSDLIQLFQQFNAAWHVDEKTEMERYRALIETECTKVVIAIAAAGNSTAFKKRSRDRTNALTEKLASMQRYVDALFKRWSRYLVLRIDIHYRQEVAAKKSIKDFQRDFKRLRNNMRHNALFRTLRGLIWVLEAGESRGLHYHLVLFLDGAESHKDAFLADQIGNYWKQMTGGDGSFHNCNAEKNKYKHLGIGMIRRDDVDKRAVITDKILPYLVKKDQLLHVRNVRTMGHGEVR